MRLAMVVIKALVLLALAVTLFILGWSENPKVTVAVAVPLIGGAILFWRWFCQKQGVPLFLWEKKEVGRDEEIGKPILMTRIVILGLVEIRNIPQKFSWVVRNSFSPSDDTSDARSYQDLRQGWQMIVLPELLWVEVQVVDMRTQGLDAKRVRTNTRTNPVDVDPTVMYEVIDPILWAVVLKGKSKDVILQAMSVAINYVTTGYSDVELVEIAHAGELMQLADAATKIMNGGVEEEVPDIGRFGIRVVIGFQNIFPLEKVLAGMAHVTESELGARAAVQRGKALESLRKGAGMPDESPWNIFLPVAEGLQNTLAAGKGGLRFPTVTLDFGGVDSSGAKAGGKEKVAEDAEETEIPTSKPTRGTGGRKRRGE